MRCLNKKMAMGGKYCNTFISFKLNLDVVYNLGSGLFTHALHWTLVAGGLDLSPSGHNLVPTKN